MWVSVKDKLPEESGTYLVSDGYDSYTVAYFNVINKKWKADNDMLEAYNYDGGASMYIASDVRFWQKIEVCDVTLQYRR